jgi:Zn-dependent peptidase ImmA (M78 family)
MYYAQNNQGKGTQQSVLAALRTLHPDRPLTVSEALRIAELQAARLLLAQGVVEAPVATDIIESLPRIIVEYDSAMPGITSGASDWDTERRSWVITLNPTEPDTRVRMTVCHEYKHILDHGKPPLLGSRQRRYYGRPPAEYIADYFAGCLLMPKRLLTRAWYGGVQRLTDLTTMFDVSPAAMTVRLNQLRLADVPSTLETAPQPTSAACSRRPRHRYERPLSVHWPLATTHLEDRNEQQTAQPVTG